LKERQQLHRQPPEWVVKEKYGNMALEIGRRAKGTRRPNPYQSPYEKQRHRRVVHDRDESKKAARRSPHRPAAEPLRAPHDERGT
jgi:hypothetical protein